MDFVDRATPDIKSLLAQPQNKWCAGTQVFFPRMANYTNLTTQRWTSFEAPSYVASIKPSCADDVAKIVLLCSNYNIPFLATGGGHGYSTSFGKLRNGLELDLGGLKQIDINVTTRTLTVGGGVTLGDVYTALYAAGKEIKSGSSTCVGFVDGTLGGGVGRYQGIHGLIVDSLLGVDKSPQQANK